MTELKRHDTQRLQIVNAPNKSNDAKQIKLADKTASLRSILTDPPANWTTQRKRECFQWAEEVISGLRGVNRSRPSGIRIARRWDA